jgi:hypothetical protein
MKERMTMIAGTMSDFNLDGDHHQNAIINGRDI